MARQCTKQPQRGTLQNVERHSDKRVVAVSEITCPNCGMAKTELMPVDACQIIYKCTDCGIILRPRPGDCCVFCSYGSVPCPPVQADQWS